MRKLTNEERRVVLMLAAEIKSDDERHQLLADLDHCMVEATVPDGSILRFEIEGYQRPPGHGRGQYCGKNAFEVAGAVKDSDGSDMEVMLLADANHRIWEFEIVRYDVGPVINPDWNTFRVK